MNHTMNLQDGDDVGLEMSNSKMNELMMSPGGHTAAITNAARRFNQEGQSKGYVFGKNPTMSSYNSNHGDGF